MPKVLSSMNRMKRDEKKTGSVSRQGAFEISRKKMLQDQIISRGIRDENVLQAMYDVPRHLFIEEGMSFQAYQDSPLNIGWGATISQPFVVAYMLSALDLKFEDKVLEVGTGCGYQAALLSRLSHHVYSIERVKELFFKARDNLKQNNYLNITLKCGDGSQGWSEFAPYDAMIVAAGSPKVPQPLIDQLSEGGRLILPVGEGIDQELKLIRKEKSKVTMTSLLPVRFVKLKGEHGHQVESA